MANVYKPPYYTVNCEKHGQSDRNNSTGPKVVLVGAPRSKRQQREAGCPACKKERLASQA